MIVTDRSRWWMWVIAFVPLGYLEVRNARLLRSVNRVLREETAPETRT